MKGKIETSSTINLPIANESDNTVICIFGSDRLEDFVKNSLIHCYKKFNIGNNLILTSKNKYSVTLNNKLEIILVVDINSINYDPGCGETCLTWQPNT